MSRRAAELGEDRGLDGGLGGGLVGPGPDPLGDFRHALAGLAVDRLRALPQLPAALRVGGQVDTHCDAHAGGDDEGPGELPLRAAAPLDLVLEPPPGLGGKPVELL